MNFMKNPGTINLILSIFMGVSITLSLQYLLVLPFWPWLVSSLLLIGIVILFIVYFTDSLDDEENSWDFLDFFKLLALTLVTLIPFSFQKVITTIPEGVKYDSKIRGPFNLPDWGLGIQLIFTAVLFFYISRKESKNGNKSWWMPLVIGLMLLAAGAFSLLFKWGQ